MSRRELVLSRGEQAAVDRLRDEAAEIKRLRRQLGQHEMWRNQLIIKLRHAGLPARFIEQHAGISNVAVLAIAKRAGSDSANGASE